MVKKWKYTWYHFPTGKSGQSETNVEMSFKSFLCNLARWNITKEWIYIPDSFDVLENLKQ